MRDASCLDHTIPGEPCPLHEPDDRRTVWPVTDLLVATFPEPRWAVPGIVAEGLNLLAGSPKVGKSWLALNVCVAVAAGGVALGKISVEGGKALYLALEDTPRRLQSRLKMVLDDSGPPEGFTVATEWERVDEGGADRLDRTLDKHPDLRLVVVDVLQRFRAPTPDRGSRYEADYQAIAALKQVADRHGVAILVNHHTRKAKADDYLDTVSGTHGLAGAADTVIVLTRSRGAADAELHVTGRDVEERTWALRTQPQWAPTLLDGDASVWALSDTRRAVFTQLRDLDAGLTPKEIAELVDISHDAARQTCRRMAEDGQLLTDGNGVYRTPPPEPLSHPSLTSPNGQGVTPQSDSSDRSEGGTQ